MEDDKISAWNSSQYFELKPITKYFYDLISSRLMENYVGEFSAHKPTQDVIRKMHLLNLYYIILKDGFTFARIFSLEQEKEIKATFVQLCGDLRKEIILITHAFPYLDVMLGQLGHKDQNVYSHIIEQLRHNLQFTEKESNPSRYYDRTSK